jgi:hypothetical protein
VRGATWIAKKELRNAQPREQTMDPRLQEMLDHHEIKQLLAEYCHGCDRCDERHMGSVYREDSWDDHGFIKDAGPEFARRMTAEMLATTSTMFHLLGQSLIKVEGDEAGAETYFIAGFRGAAEGGDMCHQLGGRYVDRLQREDGRWLIKHRVVVRDWSISLRIEEDFPGTTGLVNGSRSNADPSYAVLGRTHGG